MQVQITIELRVDFDDQDKYAVLVAAAKKSAKHIYATACLLNDKVKPQIACYSEDFFSPVQEIDALKDDIAEGEALMEGHGIKSSEGDNPSTTDTNEMLKALGAI